MVGLEDSAHPTKLASRSECLSMCKRGRYLVAVSTAGLYAASMLLPAVAPFNPEFSNTTYPGYVAFRAWKVVLDWAPGELEWWLLGAAWLANPAIWLAVVLVATGRWRAAMVAAGCGFALGLVVLPRFYPIVSGLPGYWAWIGSAGLLFAAGLFCHLASRERVSTV